jgi:hypothetical protein
MPQQITDGNVTWVGGMDTSRSPGDISKIQYSKATNVIIPDSLGGLSVRPGFHCCKIVFKNSNEEEIYTNGNVQGEGYFITNNIVYLVVVVSGYVFRIFEIAYGVYRAEIININDRNSTILSKAWVIKIPNGCIVNNGKDFPLYVTSTSQRRTDPSKGEIGIGTMGVYVQRRLFYVDQSGKQIIASDFNQPVKNTEHYLTGIIGFAAPDAEETITAITKQKTLLTYIEGGNLLFSTSTDLYSVDVRGTRSSWGDLGQSVGKVSETIPGFSACSSNSFEAFNSNVYFRSAQYGIADLKQTYQQYENFDTVNNQSIEASYFLDNDTDWMLQFCYSRSYNKRLLTTVAPERNDDGYVFWNGLLSYHPAAVYQNSESTPRRYESVWTGVRPWCITSVKHDNERDTLFVHSHDKDGRNRMYMMDGSIDHDINQFGEKVEIRGYVETRGYGFDNPFLLKTTTRRFLRLAPMERTVSLCAYARQESYGQWTPFYSNEFKIARTVENTDNTFNPLNTKAQGRTFVNLADELFNSCGAGKSFIFVQYRFEFVGPIKFDYFALSASASNADNTVTPKEEDEKVLIYNYRPDYNYSISNNAYEPVSCSSSSIC